MGVLKFQLIGLFFILAMLLVEKSRASSESESCALVLTSQDTDPILINHGLNLIFPLEMGETYEAKENLLKELREFGFYPTKTRKTTDALIVSGARFHTELNELIKFKNLKDIHMEFNFYMYPDSFVEYEDILEKLIEKKVKLISFLKSVQAAEEIKKGSQMIVKGSISVQAHSDKILEIKKIAGIRGILPEFANIGDRDPKPPTPVIEKK